MLIDRLVH